MPPPPRLFFSVSAGSSGNAANSELCDRSLSYGSSGRLLNGRTPSSPNFLYKRLREENIRRQWVNIQSLISEIARNRSAHRRQFYRQRRR